MAPVTIGTEFWAESGDITPSMPPSAKATVIDAVFVELRHRIQKALEAGDLATDRWRVGLILTIHRA